MSAGSAEKALNEIKEYTSGKRTVPVPTYFAASEGTQSDAVLGAILSPDSCADIHCLGNAGLQSVSGVNIAYLGPEHSQVRASFTTHRTIVGDICGLPFNSCQCAGKQEAFRATLIYSSNCRRTSRFCRGRWMQLRAILTSF